MVVTGATGYLGGRLCAALAGAGHAVRAFVRRTSDASGLPAGAELAYGEVGDVDSLAAAFDGCDAVFHVAAVVEPWLPDPSVFATVRVPCLEGVPFHFYFHAHFLLGIRGCCRGLWFPSEHRSKINSESCLFSCLIQHGSVV